MNTKQVSAVLNSQKIQELSIVFITIIVCAVPLARPLGLPMVITDPAYATYNTMIQVPKGSTALLCFDAGPGLFADVLAGEIDALSQLEAMGVNCVIIGFEPTGPATFASVLAKADLSGKVYGVNYVIFEYVVGLETAMASLAKNFQKLTVDYYGTSTQNLQIMKGINTINDFSLVIVTSSISADFEMEIRQFEIPYGVPMVIMTIANSLGVVAPYYKTGIIKGYLAGTPDTASYEKLIGRAGTALSANECVSLANSLAIVLIIIGNIQFWSRRRKGKVS